MAKQKKEKIEITEEFVKAFGEKKINEFLDDKALDKFLDKVNKHKTLEFDESITVLAELFSTGTIKVEKEEVTTYKWNVIK